MKIMLTILMVFMFNALPLKTQGSSYDENQFYANCYKSYNTYSSFNEYENNDYKLLVILGEYNNNIYYSVFFELNNETNYKLYIEKTDSKGYFATKNQNGSCSVYKLISDKEITIKVYKETEDVYNTKLNVQTVESYNNLNIQKINGRNNGFSNIEDLNNKSSKKTPLTYILSITFLIIILGSIITLLVLYSKKKGLFNEDNLNKQFEKEHNFKNQINDYMNQFNEENNEIDAVEEKQEEVKEIYKKLEKYDYDEIIDVSEVLKQKGFNTNYKEMSMNEKNEVMLELMKMRDTKEITIQEYNSERIKLWMQ